MQDNDGAGAGRAWGTSWRQRLRLLPLLVATATADAIAPFLRPRARRSQAWRTGISVVIPERAGPELLTDALGALMPSLRDCGEAHQVVVVVNGSEPADYASLQARYREAEFLFEAAPLPFARAIAAGLAHARHDWTLLLNNDMKVEHDCVAMLARHRADDVFAIGARILQRSANGRREETGFTDWYVDGAGVHLFHAPPPEHGPAVAHVCASGGAALFRTQALRRYLPASFAYDPFYWEDAEWSVRAWRDGWRVLFAREARATHRHRATTARFFHATELERIVERNRLLFDARHALAPGPRDALMRRVCDLPYASQREMARLRTAAGILARRVHSRRAPQATPPPVLWNRAAAWTRLADASYSYRLRTRPGYPKLLLATPFAIFPPRHGGARRTAELLRVLREAYDVVLVSDEAELYDARSFAFFNDLAAVYLVQRRERNCVARESSALDERMRRHAHGHLVAAVSAALAEHRPALVQVEHAELADLARRHNGETRWVLALHDAVRASDFTSAEECERFERTLAGYDAVTVCSQEDAALVRHRRVVCVPNGSAVRIGCYRPSSSCQLLFVGPFRYAPNAIGIRSFLAVAYERIRAAMPGVELLVLGGDEALAATADDPLFGRPGVRVCGHREDVPKLLDACTLTINPLTGIRGSAVKVVEALSAGRVCVSTDAGARGFRDLGFAGLVTVPTIAAMAPPIIELLGNVAERHRREAPDARLLEPYQWSSCAGIQMRMYETLLEASTPELVRGR